MAERNGKHSSAKDRAWNDFCAQFKRSLTPEEMANARIRFETSWEAAQQARQDARDTNADARAQARAEAAHAQAWNTAHTKAQKNLYNATKAVLRRGVDWTRARMSHRN